MRLNHDHILEQSVLDSESFTLHAKLQIDIKREDPEYQVSVMVDRVKHLDWNLLKRPWTHWLLEGLK